MADPVAAATTGRFEVRTTADSHLGWIRTRLALERTIMAWLRTATALIGFGFTIVQFFEHLQQLPGTRHEYVPHAPQYLGLALIACGILALLVSVYQYWWSVHYLWSDLFAPIAGAKKEGMRTPVLAVAALLMCIGLFAFFAVLLRLM
jgi:putative membrane protein